MNKRSEVSKAAISDLIKQENTIIGMLEKDHKNKEMLRDREILLNDLNNKKLSPLDYIEAFKTCVYDGITPPAEILVCIAEAFKKYTSYLEGNFTLDEAFGLKSKSRLGNPVSQRTHEFVREWILTQMWVLRKKAESEGRKAPNLEDAASEIIDQLPENAPVKMPKSEESLKRAYTDLGGDKYFDDKFPDHPYVRLKRKEKTGKN